MSDIQLAVARAPRWTWILATATVAATAAGIAAVTGSWRAGAVVLSSLLAAASTVPYLRDTVRRRTQPRLVTWGTWALLTAMAAAASASAGDLPAAVFSAIGAAACTLVVIFGMRFGERGIGVLDGICLALVATGITLWITFDRPGLAVLAACTIDFIGLVPTLMHAWQHPDEETPATYALIAAGGLTAGLAAWGDWTLTAQAYPVYVAVSMTAVVVLALRRPATDASPRRVGASPAV